jgi:hypothetical protein
LAAFGDRTALPFHFWILALATFSARQDQLIRSAIQIKGIHAAKRLKIFLFVFFVSLWFKTFYPNLFRNSAQAFVTSAAVSGVPPSFDFGEAGYRKLAGLAISSEPYLLKTPPWRLGG